MRRGFRASYRVRLGAAVPGTSGLPQFRPLLPSVDPLFLMLLWISFFRLKVDLGAARKCLEAREDMIPLLGTDQEPQNIFQSADLRGQPRITDLDLLWLLGFGTTDVREAVRELCTPKEQYDG